jgi:hypothetical protein
MSFTKEDPHTFITPEDDAYEWKECCRTLQDGTPLSKGVMRAGNLLWTIADDLLWYEE